MTEEKDNMPSPQPSIATEYPYWRNEFDAEFKGFSVLYREKDWPKEQDDTADSYRVFMILCNNRKPEESRLDVLRKLKEATEENPIDINGDKFWSEKW